ncbi:TetR/AcrR family transcriptional regulator [Klenkia sp. PcliD-1-E]|uniref:TetR/AcrR family transcriptional regulator n=1 Tax=Klenkia sp. PcliD-1-E TaxID=2954492 RepID=UPI0020971537|nr:TetR/AcrR family transcriptional regulator [Klenkia sp. PcliD-1-E]MCO7222548.1 TetR/AcrR family transcriptional regulator [Klenkia sp. PcliD-1-E]
MAPTPAVRTGRPRDLDLTRRLLDGAVDLVAERGYGELNAEVLALRTGAGKSAIYRRWPDMSALLADALGRVRLVEPPPATGSLRGDLVALVQPAVPPADVLQRAIGSVVGEARHDPRLRATLDRALVAPLAEAAALVCERESARGRLVDLARQRLLHRLLQALWWERCSAAGPALTPAEVDTLVDRVLLPVVRGR